MHCNSGSNDWRSDTSPCSMEGNSMASIYIPNKKHKLICSLKIKLVAQLKASTYPIKHNTNAIKCVLDEVSCRIFDITMCLHAEHSMFVDLGPTCAVKRQTQVINNRCD